MADIPMDRKTRDKLCKKLRAVIAEHGTDALKGAVMLGMHTVDHVSDIPYITCPTISTETLGNVDYKVAREFENANGGT